MGCLLIVKIHAWASPDGFIDEDGVVEIKYPLSAKHSSTEKAIQTLPKLKEIFDKNSSDTINLKHRFFLSNLKSAKYNTASVLYSCYMDANKHESNAC